MLRRGVILVSLGRNYEICPGITNIYVWKFIVMDKKAIRKEIKALKSLLSPEEAGLASERVWNKLENHPFFRDARKILLYWSMSDELSTHDFVRKWSRDKIILLPCVNGDELQLRRYEGEYTLCAGERYGIPEPTGELYENYDDIDLIVVPGVAFDRNGNRLGRGKGYYDKLLKNVNRAKKVGVCFGFQLLPQIPVEAWDIPMDLVLDPDIM